ncbi:fatty acid oxidation complex subunit alpha FadB [Catenovulum sediminis]|uniref:enoyl-CoA hydratase n=1 Tax=Catenovulum sediminis TaxID=1740262 RepID=A0ABV1RD81_9ALTE
MIYQGTNLTLQPLDNGLAELVLDAEGSVNKFDKATLESFHHAIEAAKTAKLNGLLITSRKAAFIVGADITEFLEKFSLPISELAGWLREATNIFDKLEDLPFPTVSAINGFALGGGCEAILATDFRIADNTAKIGLPEVKLGIMPGFGGTVRMSRLLGADNAMELITTGKELNADKALKLGLVDAVVEPQSLRRAGLDCLHKAVAGDFDWRARRQIKLAPLKLDNTESAMSFSLAKAMVAQQAGQHYPAPMMAVKTIEQGASLHRDEAMRIENQNFVQLTQTPQAQALVGLFLADQKVKALGKLHTKSAAPISQVGVLGAGIMGGGIAYQAAYKGTAVVLKDIQPNALDLGMAEAAKLLLKANERKKIDNKQVTQILTRIKPTLEDSALHDCDIIIEAVVENKNIKAQVLQNTETQVRKNCILASNTSTISITELSQSLIDPSRFCGMHFFNPVPKMPLVEVIRGAKTSEETISSVVSFAKQMGKTPIVVNDCPGFFVNRVLFPYLAAFNQLLVDGAYFQQVDKIMERQFGWPMGPAYLLDVIGIDTAFHAQGVMAEGFPKRMPMPTLNVLQALHQNKSFGQKSGTGFYQYSKDKKGKLQKQAASFVDSHLAEYNVQKQTLNEQDIIDRLMLPMINECVLCLEEGIVASPEEADMALIYGLGFPPFRGGVFRMLQQTGLSKIVENAKRFEHLGPLYHLSEDFKDKAAQQKNYLIK